MATNQYAFFDVDETLIGLKSMFSFRDYYLRRMYGETVGKSATQQADLHIHTQARLGVDRASINRLFWQSFKGYKHADVQIAVSSWHNEIRKQPGYYIRPAVEALREHQRNGVEPAFVSGSSRDLLWPLARELNVRHVLANQLEVADGKYTGNILAPQTIGDGKRQAILSFLRDHHANASDCFGYGDHLSDLPLLEMIGFPHVIAGSPELEALAQQRGWPVLSNGHLNRGDITCQFA